MSQDKLPENTPLLPAEDQVPVPPSGSPLEQALKKAQMEAEGIEQEAEAVAQEKAGPDADADAKDGADGAEPDGKPQDDAESSTDAAPSEAGQEEKEGSPKENGADGTDAADNEAGTGSENLPAEKENTLPAKKEDEPDEEDDGGENMSIVDHLREARKRLIVSVAAAFAGFLCCWFFVEPVFDILTKPMLEVLPQGSVAMYTTLPEAFFTRMYIAFICGLFVASPFIFYQIWRFISPGLYKEEKRFIIPVAIVSAIFFVAGGLFCYYIVFHYAFSFFMSYVTQDIVAMPKISDYLDFVLKLILAFGFIFEMPIFSFFLSRMGVLTADDMRNFRRYAILIIFIVAAILTPPDVVSQLLMAIPMLFLYEVSILVAVVFGKKKPVEEDDSEEEDEEDESEDEEKTKEEADADKPATVTAVAPSADTTAETEPAREESCDKDASTDADPVSETASDTVSESDDASSEKDEAQEQQTTSLEEKPAPSENDSPSGKDSSGKDQPAKGQE
ncbi:MAG: twin-arginine translocase subunit TatC [Desulfovibrionaceae bacterium]|nr:twin-arginine translocase subunit TatC [Desulfovibrionaceae bacterium]